MSQYPKKEDEDINKNKVVAQSFSKVKKGNGITKTSHAMMTKEVFDKRSSFSRREEKSHTCEKKQHSNEQRHSSQENPVDTLDTKKQAAIAALLYRKGLIPSSPDLDGENKES